MVVYRWNAASGMLQRMGNGEQEAPRWIPIHNEKENVLVANGWSFLDPDESDPVSAFDIDAANQEGLYQPKWGQALESDCDDERLVLSSMGYSLKAMTLHEIKEQAMLLSSELSRRVLLEGATDPAKLKKTNNDYDFSGSITSVESGIFSCAVGSLALFASTELSPSTATSGWLSFARPLSPDHIRLIAPDHDSTDQRTEVVCAKSGCHLGHYFGLQEGFCINASALDFLITLGQGLHFMKGPISYRALEMCETTPSVEAFREIVSRRVGKETIALGAGCFWHIECAFRRLPGVVSTTVGYAGGTLASPSYEQVCRDETGHAEVVLVEFDPSVLCPAVLFDCFLACHDPTKVRAHGKHATQTGQYRSCILLPENSRCESAAYKALARCQSQLDKDLSTEVRLMQGLDWFWRAEERHQRHDEKRETSDSLSCLTASAWLALYGKRSESIPGSSESLAEAIEATRLII